MKSLNFFREFIKMETAGGVVLFAAAIFAMLFANSYWHESYYSLFNYPLLLSLQNLQINFTLNQFINNGLMTIFFLLVSLEIKRELLIGELNTRAKAFLPVIAAIGGMIVPALIYATINFNHPTLDGWAIPTATDIAFSLALLTILGSRIPASLKTFLTALAIIDDLGAIFIIALFYTSHISLIYLLIALICLGVLSVFNHLKIKKIWAYGVLGFVLWFCILQSGVHPTIAGVLLGFTIPLQNNNLERKLHPWVVFIILPIFAFANAGVTLDNLQISSFINPITLGITLGLFLGKQLGIFSTCLLAVKSGIAKLPTETNWRQIYGISLICGIGFTMSLFIGSLAFSSVHLATTNFVRLGVILGSLLSGVLGYLILRFR